MQTQFKCFIKFLNYYKQKIEDRKDMFQSHFVAYVV